MVHRSRCPANPLTLSGVPCDAPATFQNTPASSTLQPTTLITMAYAGQVALMLRQELSGEHGKELPLTPEKLSRTPHALFLDAHSCHVHTGPGPDAMTTKLRYSGGTSNG